MLTVQVETFEAALPELRNIFPQHWHELGLFRDKMPLAPQYGEYVRREMNGQLFLVTARQDGRIVAYYTTQVANGFHYADTLTAHMDMMYIVPELRGKGASLPLFRHVEAELRRRGVQAWYGGYKTHNPLGLDKLLPALGFQPADSFMVKWLGATP